MIFHRGIQLLDGKNLSFRRSKILGFGGFINLGLISPKRFSDGMWPAVVQFGHKSEKQRNSMLKMTGKVDFQFGRYVIHNLWFFNIFY